MPKNKLTTTLDQVFIDAIKKYKDRHGHKSCQILEESLFIYFKRFAPDIYEEIKNEYKIRLNKLIDNTKSSYKFGIEDNDKF